jgi:tetratricopeptide (TPR) repeat protein
MPGLRRIMGRILLLASLALPILATFPRQPAADTGRTNDTSELRIRAHDLAYNLNYDEALAVMRAVAEAHPDDAGAYRSLATISWLEILFARGAVTSDDYLGSVTKRTVSLKPPPAELAARFKQYAVRARDLARARADREPTDIDALYELGAAEGLLASYSATVDGRVFAAFGEARRALDAHQTVLKLDPGRKDAGLVVGTYSYIVANLSWAVRVMAPLFGFRGDRQGGLRMVESAATPGSECQWEATFALVLLYNREGRFEEALRNVRTLQQKFPSNRLLWLEAGGTALRAGHAAEAEHELSAGIEKLIDDHRPRIFGEEALWHYKRGAARVALERRNEALADLRRALDGEARDWVRGRAHTELARLALQRGDISTAREELATAERLCNRDNDPIGVRDARALQSAAKR